MEKATLNTGDMKLVYYFEFHLRVVLKVLADLVHQLHEVLLRTGEGDLEAKKSNLFINK